MAEPKTRKNNASVKAFVDGVDNDQRRKDMRVVMKIMRRVTGKQASMWGETMVGYGTYAYKYASGRESEWFLTGVSPRKQNLTVYIMSGFSRYRPLLKKLGKHKAGKSCLYINKLEDVDLDVLEELVAESVASLRERQG